MIYFAFVHCHLLYGVEVYANTTTNQLSKLITLNNRLLRILQNKSIKHIIQNYIELILLFHCSYYIISRYSYLFINMSTVKVSYLMCSPPILKKIKYCIVMILSIRMTFTCMLCNLKLEKRLLAATLRGSWPEVQSASLIMTSLMTS